METPILDALRANGDVYIDFDGSYIGIAWDGAEVILGTDRHPDLAENYLKVFPTPQDW